VSAPGAGDEEDRSAVLFSSLRDAQRIALDMLRSSTPVMLSFLMHLIVIVGCGFALFRLWRTTRTDERFINGVIAAGFLGRAFAGQLLFWISYARLPIAPNLQVGDGLWFFALDALLYFPTSTRLARAGIGAIIAFPTSAASIAFVKLLSTAILLLGDVTSVAVLINLFCYLGTMAVIVHWSRNQPHARLAAALAICAISLSPALFLWSLQPLKDTFFQFVVIAFIAACAAWQRAWTAVPVRPWRVLRIGAAMLVTLMAIAGIRWYFAFAMFVASVVFLLLVASRALTRKSVAFAACTVLVLLLSRVFLFGGGAYVPDVIVHGLSPLTAVTKGYQLPGTLLTKIESARVGFDRAGGNTLIHAGSAISNLDRDGNALQGQPEEAENEVALSPKKAIEDLPPPMMSAVEPKVTSEKPAPPPPAKASAAKTAAPTPTKAAQKTHRKTSAPAVVSTPTAAVAPAPAPAVVVAPPPKKAAATPKAAVVTHVRKHRSRTAAAIVTRLLTGTACVIVPRSVGERLGLFHIGGGQGFFWFTDIDTLLFDVILLWAVVAVAMRLSAWWRNPLIWLLAVLTLLITLPLAYTITNYGTLFRLRAMIYVGLALIPLALAASPRREAAIPETPPAA
jgi:hypothetical protein